jgi:putative acyl-CoA dehydrogenase
MATIETSPPQAVPSTEASHASGDPAREVLNQAPPLQPVNLFEVDLALCEALVREGGEWGVERARETGAAAGSVETREHSRRAERNLPILRTHDRYGNRIDEVELDPSWHWLLRGAIEREIHSLPWRSEAGGHTVRAALFMLYGNGNDGVMCPVSMTYAAVKALRDAAPELAAEWEPRLTRPDYESGALAGMAMTERQGGSDVRANITRAHPVGDGLYEIHGHKWFCSYPPCDVFLVLAQAPGGLSCFLIERGPGMEFQRLKDKLGTRSLPSSEVEFRGIQGRLIGEEGRGVPAIIKMVNHTRLDCLLGATTGLRRGTLEAIHHARHRSAFGKLLADQPAMRNVLADLAVESEAATVTTMRVARSYDEQGSDAAAFRRFGTAVMKYWTCKRAPGHAAEALECLGGNGFVEDSGMPLLYRDAPLGSIWEGSGNVAALDVLRALAKEPEGLPAFLEECELGAGADDRLDAHLERVRRQTADVFSEEDPQFLARKVVEDLALALQGSLLVRHSPPPVADAFCATRLAGEGGRVYGTLPAGSDAGAIIERAYPV